MNKLILLMSVLILSCTNSKSSVEVAGTIEHTRDSTKNEKSEKSEISSVPLNDGKKWKADSVTKANVASLIKIVRDNKDKTESKRSEIAVKFQAGIDRLVQECSMQGPDHEALHIWLEKVIDDVEDIKEKDEDYPEAIADLDKSIISFYDFFE